MPYPVGDALCPQGPVTAEAKARAARQALRHVLTAAVPALLASEDTGAFAVSHQELAARLRPEGPLETDLVQQAAWSAWLVRRADRLMAEFLDRVEVQPEGRRKAGAALAEEPRLATAFRSLERHRARLQRAHEGIVVALLGLIEARESGVQNEPGALAAPRRPAASAASAGRPAAAPSTLNRQQRRWLARQERKHPA